MRVESSPGGSWRADRKNQLLGGRGHDRRECSSRRAITRGGVALAACGPVVPNSRGCGNAGAMETVESQKAAFHSSHSPLEISPKSGEIPTFPQPRRGHGGKVENQKQVSHFSTAPRDDDNG